MVESNINLTKLINFLGNKSFEEVKKITDYEVKNDGNLYMLSFKNDSNFTNELVREVNGVIFEKETNKLVHHCFSKSYEGFDFEEEYITSLSQNVDNLDLYSGTIEDCSVELMSEGTLIRVFFYDGWKIGTARNINAAFSHWGNENSFKELFLQTCEKDKIDIQKLDKNYCYSYILQHKDIKLGLDLNDSCIIPLNKVNLKTFEEIRLTEGYKVQDSFEELKNKERKFNENYIVILKDGKRVKFLSPEYRFIKSVLNNNPSMKWAYLEAIQKGSWQYLRHYFKSEEETFLYVDEMIKETVAQIQSEYYHKFVLREKIKITKKYEKTLKQLHSRYLKNKEKTTKEIVQDQLFGLNTKTLYWILSL